MERPAVLPNYVFSLVGVTYVVSNYFYGDPFFIPFMYCIVRVCSVIRYVQRPTGQVPVRTQSHRGRKKIPVPPLFTNVTRIQNTSDAVPAKWTFIAAFRSSVLYVSMPVFNNDSEAFLRDCF